MTDSRLEQDCGTAEIEPKSEMFRAESSRENPNIDTEIRGCSDELIEPSSRAVDLISTFGNLHMPTKEIHCTNGDKETKFDFKKELELSLRSDFSGSSCKQASETTEEWQRLNHSDASAFSRCVCPFLFTFLVLNWYENTKPDAVYMIWSELSRKQMSQKMEVCHNFCSVFHVYFVFSRS